jgi:hypothetical protein
VDFDNQDLLQLVEMLIDEVELERNIRVQDCKSIVFRNRQ